MHNTLLLLRYLIFMNPEIGLRPAFTTQHCIVFDTQRNVPPCNRVNHTAVPTSAEIEEIKAFFGTRSFTWVVDDTDIESQHQLEAHGLLYKGSFPAMMMPLGSLQQQHNDADIIVRAIDLHNHDDVAHCASVIATVFNYEAVEFSKVMNYFINHVTPGNMMLYLGSYQGHIAAAGMALRHQDTTTLHWITTLPEYRNKGLGTAIMHAALTDMQEAGCTQALLLASTIGKPLYEHMGFKEYALYRLYANLG